MLEAIRAEFRRFVDSEVVPIAQDVHRRDVLIPMELLKKMGELGVFGLTIPEEYGGQGLGKVAMCVVTEELSRGYIGVGSLGTRAEIAAELILIGGTDEQKQAWLPKIASGQTLPTAVFTEPNYGSDLAHIKARAEKQAGRLLESVRCQDLDHPRHARRLDDLARAHQPGGAGLRGPQHVPRAETTRQRGQTRNRGLPRQTGSPEPRSRCSATAA